MCKGKRVYREAGQMAQRITQQLFRRAWLAAVGSFAFTSVSW